eukprot:GHVU01032404.1.p1 GENE.GHVU01032404.1~~GHVU01032404.1.p1  ORF type:complete len:288 (-),score=37.39 GHVU01032404.1:458-1321(-)
MPEQVPNEFQMINVSDIFRGQDGQYCVKRSGDHPVVEYILCGSASSDEKVKVSPAEIFEGSSPDGLLATITQEVVGLSKLEPEDITDLSILTQGNNMLASDINSLRTEMPLTRDTGTTVENIRDRFGDAKTRINQLPGELKRSDDALNQVVAALEPIAKQMGDLKEEVTAAVEKPEEQVLVEWNIRLNDGNRGIESQIRKQSKINYEYKILEDTAETESWGTVEELPARLTQSVEEAFTDTKEKAEKARLAIRSKECKREGPSTWLGGRRNHNIHHHCVSRPFPLCR